MAVVACVDPLTTNATNSPEWEMKNAKGYAQTVTGKPPDTAFGWGLDLEGDVARWRECSTADTCSLVQRERPKADVLAIEKVGTATVGDAGVVAVVKLTLAPGRKYVVPYKNPAKPR
jgi:hypothetical protein